MRGLSAREAKEILSLAEALTSGDPEQPPEMSIKNLERSTQIKAWGHMAVESSRLGYTRPSYVFTGTADPAIRPDQFDRITDAVYALPMHYRSSIISVYQNGKNITQLAEKVRIDRNKVERWVWHGLERVDATINTVIRVTAQKG